MIKLPSLKSLYPLQIHAKLQAKAIAQVTLQDPNASTISPQNQLFPRAPYLSRQLAEAMFFALVTLPKKAT